jgi:hypothetical protein
MRGVRKTLVLAALAFVASLLPRVAVAEELPQNDGFVYMIISAPEPDFTLGNFDNEGPSGTILTRLGMFVSGPTVLDARFLAENVPPFALPEGVSLSDLDGHQVSVIGGFQVPNPIGEGTLPHIVTPTPPDPEDPIGQLVQQAIFNSTHDGRLDGLGSNPSVADIVQSIVGGNESLSTDAVFSAVFSTPMTLHFASGIVSTEGET